MFLVFLIRKVLLLFADQCWGGLSAVDVFLILGSESGLSEMPSSEQGTQLPCSVSLGGPGGSLYFRMTLIRGKVLEAFPNVLGCPQR